MNRKRVLISAFAFSPYQGSECAVGWNVVTRLARSFDVTVLFGDLSREQPTKQDLEKYFSKHHGVENLTLHYVPPSRAIQIIERLHRLPGFWFCYYLAYNLWQHEALRAARGLQRTNSFDLVHQLTMIGYREPGYLWKLGIPFFWGPIGGASNEPLAYWSLYSLGGRCKVLLRTLLNEGQKRFARRPRNAAQYASKLWCVTEDDLSMTRDIWHADVEQMNEVGIDFSASVAEKFWDGVSPLRIVWSGIHTPRKALPILLYAIRKIMDENKREDKMFNEAARPKHVLVDILGAGPETTSWMRLARRLGLDSVVTWHGSVSRDSALEIMRRGHVSAITSLKEATSVVLVEAIAMGLPVICHDACGMRYIIDETCGLKIPLACPEVSVNGFKNAITSLLLNPCLVRRLSQGALKRAHSLSWEKMVEKISNAYNTKS